VVGDRIGRRRTLVLGLAVFTLASAACGLASTIGVLVAARTVQGAGAAMVMPAALSLVGSAFGAEQRGRAMGIFAGITGLAILGGPVIGGVVVQGLAWQWIFWPRSLAGSPRHPSATVVRLNRTTVALGRSAPRPARRMRSITMAPGGS